MTRAVYLTDFESFAANGGGSGPMWLPNVRRAAIGRFAALGFPTPRNEDWHFTSVAPIAEAEFHPLEAASAEVRSADLAPFLFGRVDWPTLVFVNGRHSPGLSTVGGLPPGVRVMNLASAWREAQELVERHLSRIATFDAHSFTALNTAFMYDGAVIHVPRGVQADAPIHLLHVVDPIAARSVMHPRHLIVVDQHASARVIESYVSLGDARYFTNAVTEVALGDGAHLAHYKIQRESQRAYHVGTIEVHQSRDSKYASFSFATGAALSRTNIYTVLDGEGAEVWMNGLYMVDGEQHVDHQTRIEHAQPNCASHEVYKGILDGASHGVFNGKVFVRPVAQKTDGKQENNNLLLSDKARIDTKPQLEIFADDVKCTHGATVGKLDALALFYMKSRGLSAEVARRLLVYAFAADVLERLEVADVRDALEDLTLARFTRLEEERGPRTEEGRKLSV
ncbi:MAG: Fe-S cluster assembly protein SufD [Gemmatimonadaceae bacterium]